MSRAFYLVAPFAPVFSWPASIVVTLRIEQRLLKSMAPEILAQFFELSDGVRQCGVYCATP